MDANTVLIIGQLSIDQLCIIRSTIKWLHCSLSRPPPSCSAVVVSISALFASWDPAQHRDPNTIRICVKGAAICFNHDVDL